MKSIVLAVAFLSSGAAIAQNSVPPTSAESMVTQPDPAALAAAERLLTAMDYDRTMKRMADAMSEQLGPALKKSIENKIGEPVDDELIRRLAEVQSSFLRARLVEDRNMRRAIAVVYARHLSATELDRVAGLYRDPVMQKWADVAPAIMGDMLPLLVDVMNTHRGELETKAKKTVTDYFAEKERAGGS